MTTLKQSLSDIKLFFWEKKLNLGDLLFQKHRDNTIKIKDYFQLVCGKTPPTNNPEYYQNGTIKWINSGVLNSLLFLDNITKPTKLITAKAKRECVLAETKSQSILFSNINLYWRKIVRNNNSTGFTFGEHVWQIRSSNPQATATLFFALRQIDFRVHSTGTTFKEIRRSALLNMKINWVSDPAKQKIFFRLLNNHQYEPK